MEMAAASPILIGLSGATFLLTAETGSLIQNYTRSTTSKLLDVYDPTVGYTTGHVFHDFTADYNVDTILTGNTGVAAASVGVALTLANTDTGGGVDSGTIYTLNTTLMHSAEQLRRWAVTAKQWANA